MTKTIIKDYLKQIEKYGGKLITFNSNKYQSRGLNGFIDHIIIYKKFMVFIEVKIGKDTLKSNQIETGKYLSEVAESNPYIFYIVANETNYKLITECLVQWNLNGLKKL
jgi:hypothetical protein